MYMSILSFKKVSAAAIAATLGFSAMAKAASVPYSTSFENPPYAAGTNLVTGGYGWTGLTGSGDNNDASATITGGTFNTGAQSVNMSVAGSGTIASPSYSDYYNSSAISPGSPLSLPKGSFQDLNVSFAMNTKLGAYTNNGTMTNALTGVDIFDSTGSVVASLFAGVANGGPVLYTNNSSGQEVDINTINGFSGDSYTSGDGNWGTYKISVDPTAGTFTVTYGSQSYTSTLGAYSGSIEAVSIASIDQGVTGGAYFDDLSITTAAPEPASIAMIGLGGLMLLAKRPKKRLV
jgi:hypothetical protein